MSTVLELLGFACLIAFAWLIWPYAVLLVIGAGMLLVGLAVDALGFLQRKSDV